MLPLLSPRGRLSIAQNELWDDSCPFHPPERRYSEACVEQHIAVGSQLRGHSDPETAAKLVIHTAVAYSQLRGLNEFAFDTEATSTCAVSGVCMGKLVSGGAYNSDTPERLGWLASHSWSLEGLIEPCQFAR